MLYHSPMILPSSSIIALSSRLLPVYLAFDMSSHTVSGSFRKSEQHTAPVPYGSGELPLSGRVPCEKLCPELSPTYTLGRAVCHTLPVFS